MKITAKNALLYFIISLTVSIRLNAKNPLIDFCGKNKIEKKSVFVALNPSDCRSCILPLEDFFNKIREANKLIPVYIITSSELSISEQNLFRLNIGISGQDDNILICYDELLHHFLTKKEEENPMTSVVSNGALECHFNLKNESLSPFFKSITPEFYPEISGELTFKNHVLSPTGGLSSFLFINSSSYLHTWNYNCLSKYNKDGILMENLFFDSLKLDYFKTSQIVLPEALYNKNLKHFEKVNYKTDKSLLSLISIVKFQENSIALCCNLTSYVDSVYKGRSASYINTSAFLCILDTNLNYTGRLILFDTLERDEISFYELGRNNNNHFYFARFDRKTETKFLSEFHLNGNVLKKTREFKMPYPTSPVIETICPLINDSDFVYVSYAFGDHKPEKFELYEIDLNNNTTKLAIKLNSIYVHGPYIQITPKRNFLLYAGQPKQTKICGYDGKLNKLVKCKEISERPSSKTISSWFPFFEENNLKKVTVCE